MFTDTSIYSLVSGKMQRLMLTLWILMRIYKLYIVKINSEISVQDSMGGSSEGAQESW